ncbi:hypothetical protein [Pseudomonas syringae group genomosp. 3]|uniref:Uncharacterized protein n=1 Tax=Pseudomonas syringae pv. coriandricola TaxID=264453 RepID=A0A3M3JRV6_9PSED|nr:hypothetical protein [Pseudomonas syringae group genomosp. 3]RMN13518.1 hypothetical protein ALQ65_200006 [Pseudomonas syringae pv. coriandricola]
MVEVDLAQFPLPADSTGRFQIRGCVEEDGGIAEAVNCDPAFWGVYAENAEGLHMWVCDCETEAAAAKFVADLKAVHAFV